MNSDNFTEARDEVSRLMCQRLPSARKSIVDEAVRQVFDRMVEQGRAHLVSKEEEMLLKAFRRFKIGCKPGSVFKWQTHPEAGVSDMVEAGELEGVA